MISAFLNETVPGCGYGPSEPTSSEMIRFQQAPRSGAHEECLDECFWYVKRLGYFGCLGTGREAVFQLLKIRQQATQ